MVHKLKFSLLAIIAVAPANAHATGLHDCGPTDRSAWLSEAALTEKLENEGWAVRRMKVDGGCWEVYGTTPEGQRVEGYFHPVTGAVELIAQRGRVLFRADSE